MAMIITTTMNRHRYIITRLLRRFTTIRHLLCVSGDAIESGILIDSAIATGKIGATGYILKSIMDLDRNTN